MISILREAYVLPWTLKKLIGAGTSTSPASNLLPKAVMIEVSLLLIITEAADVPKDFKRIFVVTLGQTPWCCWWNSFFRVKTGCPEVCWKTTRVNLSANIEAFCRDQTIMAYPWLVWTTFIVNHWWPHFQAKVSRTLFLTCTRNSTPCEGPGAKWNQCDYWLMSVSIPRDFHI